ncbi:MAG TPA: hypothetical protein VGX78_22730 [Pirellulales bacterium]|jgi:hypothetical protein|nr:hypothetical protein [Pirellulales bacterium]
MNDAAQISNQLRQTPARSWHQFSLKSLFVLTVLSAIGMASLRSASDVWNAVALTTVVASLSIAVPITLLRRRELRPFWLGFTTIGWLYAALIFGPSLNEHVGRKLWSVQFVNKLADWVEPWWRERTERLTVAQMGGASGAFLRGIPFREGMFPGSLDTSSLSTTEIAGPVTWRANFYRICHFWSVLLVAWMAGATSRFACRAVSPFAPRKDVLSPRERRQ